MDAAEPAHVGLDGFKSPQQEMKLSSRHRVELHLHLAESGGDFSRRGQTCELPFQIMQLRVQRANLRTEILLVRSVLMHCSQVKGDIGRTALIKVRSEQT